MIDVVYAKLHAHSSFHCLDNAVEVVTLLKNALPQLMPYADEMATVLRQAFQNGSPALGALAGGTRYVDDLAESVDELSDTARAAQRLTEAGAETARETEDFIHMRPGVNKPEEFSLKPQSALDEDWYRKYNAAKEYYAQAAANSGTADTVTYYRVQTPANIDAGNQVSWPQIMINGDGTVSIPNKSRELNVSAYTMEHALYYQGDRRPGSMIVAFDIPRWLDDIIRKEAVLQDFYNTNSMSHGAFAPKMPDLSLPGYKFELPAAWNSTIEEFAINARIISYGGG